MQAYACIECWPCDERFALCLSQAQHAEKLVWLSCIQKVERLLQSLLSLLVPIH